MNIDQKIIDILEECFGPVDHTTTKHKLEMDSLDEVEFDMCIPDEKAESLSSVADVVSLVESMLEKPMQIKIVKCHRSFLWYADQIGKTFEVENEILTDAVWAGWYAVKIDEQGGGYVHTDDVEIVNENNDRRHTMLNVYDKLDLLESHLASSNGCITIFWDVFEKKIKYQILLDDDDIEMESIEDVYKVLEAQALIEGYKKQ